MKEFTVKFSEEDLKSIVVLLGRTNLVGNEVPVFNSIIEKLRMATPVEIKKEIENDNK